MQSREARDMAGETCDRSGERQLKRSRRADLVERARGDGRLRRLSASVVV